MTNYENVFTRQEQSEAKEAFALWQGKEAEQLDEYTLRKRKAELYALVRKVIKNELDPSMQEFVRLYWYEEKSLSEISEIMGLDKSTLSRREKKINDIIYDKLKYAMEYRFGKAFNETARLVIKSRSPVCYPCDGESISQRIRNLRLRQSLEARDIAEATGIGKKRMDLIEKEGGQATADELSRLARLFGTTSDYIIFGNKGGICNENKS